MASITFARSGDRGEARFFFTMACAMAATIIAGFSLNIGLGRSNFGMPLLVHVHAVVMMGWLGLYVAQNALIFGNNVALHRRLGWLSLLFLPAMLILGVMITRLSLQTTGGPPFFDQNQFLISNPLQLLGAIGLAAAAVIVRKDTGWHRRLMYSMFAGLTGPGFGRLLPMPFLIPYGWYVAALAGATLFIVIGMIADKRRYGRVHPAWLVGLATMFGIQVVADLFAYSPLGYQFTEWFLAGTPGAERQMEAFFPPM
ncbi:MAG: hypothetical protein B7Z08_04490 [Sphingomonadales bacterium 32-68-7]|nr:MAG: hypothetical protein B7Z33_07455 [Sphingomonadales bacterium 12-68-11]OYX09589.1 MAG: hypothetical protein B7Z08_04490 [Sphingomonadales bacterium 32-68-7]